MFRRVCARQGASLATFKDQVIFERDELLTRSGKPYTVFTPCGNAWLKRITPTDLGCYLVAPNVGQLCAPPGNIAVEMPALDTLGFAPTHLGELELPTGMSGANWILEGFVDDAVARISAD